MKENTIVTLRELVKEFLNMDMPKIISTNERQMFVKALNYMVEIRKLPNSYKYLYLGKKESIKWLD